MRRNRGFLLAVAVFGVSLGGGHPAVAQNYPDKPIRMIVPPAPGGPTDVPARLASQILQPKLGQPVVVENRPGAGGALGARAVDRRRRRTATRCLPATPACSRCIPSVSASAGYDPTKNFAAVAKVSESYQILVVQPSSPWKTVKELVDHAKANPGKLNYAHTGAGGLPHLTGELFMSAPARTCRACRTAAAARRRPPCSARRCT